MRRYLIVHSIKLAEKSELIKLQIKAIDTIFYNLESKIIDFIFNNNND